MANTAITVGTSTVPAVSFAPTGTTFRVEVDASQQGTMWLLSKVGAEHDRHKSRSRVCNSVH